MITTQRAAALCLALFVFAGYYKAADLVRLVPVDLTLVFWALTVGFCLLALWRERRLPPGTLPMLAVFAAMAVGLHWPADLGGYPAQKELRLFSLTALAALAPLVLLQDDDERQLFLYTVGVLGAAMAIFAVVEVAAGGRFSRISAFNTNPILLARASGFTALLLCTLFWLGRIRLWIFLPAVAVALLGLLASGSRGPLAALLVTAAIVAAFCVLRAESRPRVLGSLAGGSVALAAAVFYMAQARISAGRRLLRLFSGEWGDTELSRWSIWRETAQVITESPLGVGWGWLGERVQVYHKGVLLQHPHNIILEITAEAGWLAAAVFIILAGVATAGAVRRAYRAAGASGSQSSIRFLVVLGALSYWLVCAMFSGDVNDNRTLWVMVGMALAAQGDWRTRGIADGGNGGGSLKGAAAPS